VNNTSDANKPVSTATQTALDSKLNITDASNTYATITNLGTTNSNVSSLTTRVGTAETNIGNLQTRTNSLTVSGDVLTINSRLALTAGVTGSISIGDNSNDSVTFVAQTVSGLTKSHVGLSNVNNTSDANKPVSTATQTALDSKLNITDASNTYATITNLGTTNSNVSSLTTRVGTAETNIGNLQTKTNSLNVSGDVLTINSRLALTAGATGSISIGDNSNDTINFIGQTITGLTRSHIGLSNVNNTSDANKPISSATQSALDLKANINNPTFTGSVGGITKSMVGLGNVDNTSDANKPISSATQSALDLKANITYVDSSIANLVNSAPSTLDTLNELSSALGNDPNFATSVATSIGTKANDNAVVKLTGDQSITGNKDFATILLGGTNLNTRISAIETKNTDQDSAISTINTNVSNLQSKTNVLSYDAGTDTLSISSKVTISKDLSDLGSVYLGDGVGNDIIYLRGNLNVTAGSTATNITPTELSRLSGVSSGIQSQLNNRVTLATTQTISGQKNFTGGVQLNGTDVNSIFQSQAGMTAYQLVSAMSDYLTNANASSTYQTQAGMTAYQPISGMSDYLTNTNASATYQTQAGMTAYQPVSAMSSYLTTSSASSTYQTQAGMTAYLTTSSASSTYQTQAGMTAYAPINNPSFTGVQSVSNVAEQLHNAGSGTALSLSYTSIKGVVSYSPSANYTLTLTNVPTSSNVATYTLTFIYNTKFWANNISVNGTSYTMRASGGLANVSINASATHVLQTISICFLNSATPTIVTNIASLW
jgi:hypothetical protein